MDVAKERAPGTRAGLAALGLAALGLVAAVVALVPWAGLVGQRWSTDPADVPHAGWQVDVVEIALGLLLLGLLVCAARVALHRWRSLRGSTPHLRVPLLLALLPGVALGALLETPLTATVSWASDHTASASSARHELAAHTAALRRSPTVRTHARAAGAELAALLLRPTDLGAGWYDAFDPNPAAGEPVLGEQPGVVMARSTLVRTRREGAGWALADPLLQERVTRLPTPAAARLKASTRYVPPGLHDRTRVVAGVRVLQLVTPLEGQNESASFAVGRYTFTLGCGGMPGTTFDALVDAAVRRGQQGVRG